MVSLTSTASSVAFSALILTSATWFQGGSSQVLATPATEELPLELEKIKEIADMFLHYCAGADCQALATQSTRARRHLLEDDSVSNHVLEAMVENRYEGNRKLQVLQCLGETLLCHLYLDNLYMPQVEEYNIVRVSVADKGFEKQCAQSTGSKAIEFVPSIKGIKDEQFVYQSKGPKSLQGVFSLNYFPCASSLVSFAETSTGATSGISTGTLGDVEGNGVIPVLNPDGSVFGPVRAPSDYVYAMRVLGDHNWAFQGGFLGSLVQGLVIGVDLVYKWVLLDGTLQNPKRFQIIPDIKIPFTCIRLEIKGCLEELLRFEQTLVENCDDINLIPYPGFEAAFSACKGGSVVWRRDNWFGGDPAVGYYAVQVVNGTGAKLDPAFDLFTDIQDECNGISTDSCTTNIYGTLSPKGAANPGFCHCAYTGDRPYGLDNIAEPFFGGSGSTKGGLKRRDRRGLGEKTLEIKEEESTHHREGGLANHIARRTQIFDQCPDYTIAPTDTPSPTAAPKKGKGGGKGKL